MSESAYCVPLVVVVGLGNMTNMTQAIQTKFKF